MDACAAALVANTSAGAFMGAAAGSCQGGIVRTAVPSPALMVHEMVRHGAVLAAVKAEDLGFFVLVLLRHRVLHHVLVNLAPAIRHVTQRLLADRTAVVTLRVVVQTL